MQATDKAEKDGVVKGKGSMGDGMGASPEPLLLDLNELPRVIERYEGFPLPYDMVLFWNARHAASTHAERRRPPFVVLLGFGAGQSPVIR